MKLIGRIGLTLIVILMLALAGLTSVSASQGGDKVFVCKYVGTPGEDERLQTGQNPISVSVNAIPEEPVVIGSYFADAQGRSFVLAFDIGQPEPSVSECPGSEQPSSEPSKEPSPSLTPSSPPASTSPSESPSATPTPTGSASSTQTTNPNVTPPPTDTDPVSSVVSTPAGLVLAVLLIAGLVGFGYSERTLRRRRRIVRFDK